MAIVEILFERRVGAEDGLAEWQEKVLKVIRNSKNGMLPLWKVAELTGVKQKTIEKFVYARCEHNDKEAPLFRRERITKQRHPNALKSSRFPRMWSVLDTV